jgi:hypothetical protein
MPIFSCLRTLLAIGILAAVPALSAAPASSQAPTWAGRHDCQFIVPAEWQDSRVIWDGACAAGKANGQGVLRGYRKAASTRLFFGQMKHGELNLGVIEEDDGYIAGEFVGGAVVPNPERNTLIKAFESASGAAKALGQRLKQTKNASSSAYYLRKAQELEQQMD